VKRTKAEDENGRKETIHREGQGHFEAYRIRKAKKSGGKKRNMAKEDNPRGGKEKTKKEVDF